MDVATLYVLAARLARSTKRKLVSTLDNEIRNHAHGIQEIKASVPYRVTRVL